MDNDKKTIIDGAAVNEEHDVEKTNDDPSNNEEHVAKQRSLKKKKRFVIISLVVLVTVICIFLSAIIIFSLWTSRVIFQEKTHRTIREKEVDEELYQDTVDSLTFYHVQDKTMEFWVILDYNRELEIMKVNRGESNTCYVSPRDSAKTQERNQTIPDPVQTTPGTEGQRNETLPVVSLRPSSRPIREKSMLGRRGQQLCQNVDTFWILSSCSPSDEGDTPVSRVRRATWQVYSCYWDWTRCRFIYFADSPGTRYYGCDWTCGYRTFEY